MADSQVSLGASLIYAWDLLRTHWRAIWGGLALVSLTATVQAAGAYAGNIPMMIVGVAAQAVTLPVLYGAIFRLAFADRHAGDAAFTPGPSGLQWRAMEWRLLASSLLLGVFLAIILMLALVLAGGVAIGILMNKGIMTPPQTPEAFAAALGPTGQLAVTVIALAGVMALLFFFIRLRLAVAATADSGKIVVLKSWPLTKGQFIRIFGAIFLIQLPLTLVQALLAAMADGDAVGAAGAGQMAPGAAMGSALVTGVVYGGVVLPLTASAIAYFFRGVSTSTTVANR